jgi:hypothetical protein
MTSESFLFHLYKSKFNLVIQNLWRQEKSLLCVCCLLSAALKAAPLFAVPFAVLLAFICTSIYQAFALSM